MTTAAQRVATRESAFDAPPASGDLIVEIALQHLDEIYELGARAPMGNAQWCGPWDCAEFASWCVYQASGVLFGTRPGDDDMRADAYTGFWADQARAADAIVPVEQAARIRGACMLREPKSRRTGHIVICDGEGGTVEAHSSDYGVVCETLDCRRWDYGILVPGIDYFLNEDEFELEPPPPVLRVTRPLMRGPRVAAVQEALHALNYAPGSVDGIYGPQTASAVRMVQADNGVVADGEVGPITLALLGLDDD